MAQGAHCKTGTRLPRSSWRCALLCGSRRTPRASSCNARSAGRSSRQRSCRRTSVGLRMLVTSASVSVASIGCVAWSWCAQAGIHNPRLLHLVWRATLDVLLNLSQGRTIGQHPLDGRLAVNHVRHCHPSLWRRVTDRSGYFLYQLHEISCPNLRAVGGVDLQRSMRRKPETANNCAEGAPPSLKH